jgi:hypothetical protein
MEDPVADAILNQYFRRLEQALSGLAPERRTQIVEDLRAHVDECLQAEADHSDATILAILDRVGDPDEIAREAMADEAMPGEVMPGAVEAAATTDSAATRSVLSTLRSSWRLTTPGVALLIAAVVVVIVLSSGQSPAAPAKSLGPTVHGRLVAAHTDPRGSGSGGWLPASDVSGDHQSPGASDCSPQTTSGSESVSALEARATQVASGSTAGQSWSVWSKNGQSGATGLEDGGVVVGGAAYGLCPGFPNPAEMELLEPAGGGDGIAYGVIGYAGSAKVAIYGDTFGNFATTKLVGSTTAQTANGVGFFITSLSESACDLGGVEMNTASSNYAAEHNLAFSASDCTNGQLVPISDSQGIWQLPAKRFPDKFESFNGGGGSVSTPTLGNTAGMYNSHKAARILLSRYRILTTNRVAPRMLPAMVERMSSHSGALLGLDTSDVAEVQPARGITMWLIPGTSGFCGIELDNNGGTGSCGLIHGGLGPGTTGSGPQGAVAEGFAPNGVTRITVSLAGGHKLSVPVRDNAYFVRVPGARISGVRASSR